MTNIDPATLTDAVASAYLDAEIACANRASMAAGIASGAAKRRFSRYLKQHNANVKALTERLHGPVPTSFDDLSDDELLAELAI